MIYFNIVTLSLGSTLQHIVTLLCLFRQTIAVAISVEGSMWLLFLQTTHKNPIVNAKCDKLMYKMCCIQPE